MSIAKEPFGQDDTGRRIDKITMTNKHGASVSVISFGASLQSVMVPDAQGSLGDVCLGFDTVSGYESKKNGHIGATIGRYANRIAGGKFSLNGQEYQIPTNEKGHALHGGLVGFGKKVWVYETTESSDRDFVAFYYTAHDGEEGFPGNLRTQVVYSFGDDNRLEISYIAQSDADTVVNLTNHSYFNLKGEGDVKDHLLQIISEEIAETDDDLIPTGWMMEIADTPYDVRQLTRIGDALGKKDTHPAFQKANGFDVSYDLPGEGLRLCAVLREPTTRREMRVYTDQPAVQCYSGQGLNYWGKGGEHYGPYGGIALETQHHPDSVNHEEFPSTFLKAGDSFRSVTVYAFGTY